MIPAPRPHLATECHELLLRAAVWHGQDARDAWRDWNARFTLNELDSGSTRLLPLVYRNLLEHGIRDPAMGRLRGFHRSTWYRNRRLVGSAKSALARFHDAGVRTMLLKGAAMIAAYYHDYGLRPLGDVDVMVPVGEYGEALRVLKRAGWSCSSSYDTFTPEYLWLVHAYHFKHESGGEIDLHAHLLPECLSAEADRDFWEGAIHVDLDDLPVRVLDPASQLLHLAVHGTGPRPEFLVRWAADAMTLLSVAGADLDWTRLVDLAKKHGLVLPVWHALHYLQERLGARVPSTALEALDTAAATPFERLDFAVKTRCPTTSALFLWMHYARLLRAQARVRGAASAFFGLPRSLQHIWAAESLRAVPGLACSKALRRLRRTPAPPAAHPLDRGRT